MRIFSRSAACRLPKCLQHSGSPVQRSIPFGTPRYPGIQCVYAVLFTITIYLASAICCFSQSQPPAQPLAENHAPPAFYPVTESAFTSTPSLSSVIINGRPYLRPTPREQFHDYLRDTYGWPALARTTARAALDEARGKPEQWREDWEGFNQRFGSAGATTVIDGNIRYGLEMLLREDMRYLPCHLCSARHKLENALLAEVTARHHADGRRFFTPTPTITDMAGPIVANSFWIPGHSAIDGFTSSRLTFATRIGGHLFTEFVLEHRHHDPEMAD